MCEIDFGDSDDTIHVLREGHRRARHPCRCHDCHGPIGKGERHLVVVYVHEGHVSTERTCGACERDMRAFCEEHGVRTILGGWLHFLEDCIETNRIDDETDYRWVAMRERAKARRAVVDAGGRVTT